MAQFSADNADLELPQGSIILVTGVSGMIAVHIADEALKAGFRVRGTVRSVTKGEEVTKILDFSPSFEFIVVEDMSVSGAFDLAMQGVSAVIHSASIHSFPETIDELLQPTLRAINNILEVALVSQSIKSVTFTSSTGAASSPKPGVKFHIGRDSWNTEAVEAALNTSEEEKIKLGFEWRMQVYRASKVEAERAIWNFVDQQKPKFRVNVVNPGLNFGKAKGSMGVSGAQLLSVLKGSLPPIPSLYMVDVVDDARIHIASAIDQSVSNQRIFACDEPFTWHRIVQIIRGILPDANLPETNTAEPIDISTIENQLGASLLRKWWNQPGYKGLETTIRESVDMCLEKNNGEYSHR